MKNLFLLTVILFSFSTSIFSQEQNFQLYSYGDVSVDIKQIMDAPEGYGALNINVEGAMPMRLAGEYHKNFRHGFSAGIGILVTNSEGGPSGPNFVTANVGYLVGYEYPVSKQLSIMPSLKPTLNFVAITDIHETGTGTGNGDDESETIRDFSFSGLIGLKARYFFSEESDYGISGEMLTSTEGGFGFLVGFAWRTAL